MCTRKGAQWKIINNEIFMCSFLENDAQRRSRKIHSETSDHIILFFLKFINGAQRLT